MFFAGNGFVLATSLNNIIQNSCGFDMQVTTGIVECAQSQELLFGSGATYTCNKKVSAPQIFIFGNKVTFYFANALHNQDRVIEQGHTHISFKQCL